MNTKSHFYILLTAALILFSLNVYSQENAIDNTGKLVVTFTNIKSDEGELKINLYTNESQWPDYAPMTFIRSKDNIKNGRITISIDSLPQATYGLVVLDDLNSNADMDYTLGLPSEGWGMSNNPSFFKLKAPAYEEVVFELDAAIVMIDVKLNYVLVRKK